MNGHRNQFHLVASILAAFLLAWGCSSSSPYPQMDAEEVFAEAEALYEAEEWSDAVEALEHFTGRFPIHEKQADARWMLANAYFERGDYIQAATEFDGFAVSHREDPRAPEAALMTCRSYAGLAPIPQRDQEYTERARDRCDFVARDYPGTDVAERALEVRDEMLEILAEKDFVAGEQYKDLGAYDSAIIYFEEVVENYPETSWAPRALLAKYESYREIGYEREAQETRERLLAEFPDSAEAERIQETVDG